ncbi:MAG TPA: nuclear transport factor 2 family protein [Candidatus Acidoferrales bacterium]|nr:nuclear transport factor 2 family protein [Candidatus Acidoferrales bacterium]
MTLSTKTIDALDVAERLFAAIQLGDVDAVGEIYAPDAQIWHNHDRAVQTREENLAVLRWVVKNVTGLRYEEVRRQRTELGFVQQHVLRGTTRNGAALEIAACIVCTVVDGRIARLDEYIDTAQVAALLRS